VIQLKPCPVQLSFKVAEEDKLKMANSLQARRRNEKNGILASPSVSEVSIDTALPPLKYLPEDEDGWATFEEPILYVYAGKGPFVGRYVILTQHRYLTTYGLLTNRSDLMAFPVSLPDDGLIDIMTQRVVG
jgi:hypothetical protein